MTTKTIFIACLSAVLLAGCVDYQIVFSDPEENYLSFNHPFTDKAIAEVQAKANQLCEQRKKEAVQTTKSCSLTKCTTNYQCVKKEDITKYGL